MRRASSSAWSAADFAASSSMPAEMFFSRSRSARIIASSFSGGSPTSADGSDLKRALDVRSHADVEAHEEDGRLGGDDPCGLGPLRHAAPACRPCRGRRRRHRIVGPRHRSRRRQHIGEPEREGRRVEQVVAQRQQSEDHPRHQDADRASRGRSSCGCAAPARSRRARCGSGSRRARPGARPGVDGARARHRSRPFGRRAPRRGRAARRVPAGVASLVRALQLDEEALAPERPRQHRARRSGSASPSPCRAQPERQTRPSFSSATSAASSDGGAGLGRPSTRVRVRGGQQPAEIRVADRATRRAASRASRPSASPRRR